MKKIGTTTIQVRCYLPNLLRIAARESRAIWTAVEMGLLNTLDKLNDPEIDVHEREQLLWELGLRHDAPTSDSTTEL